MPHPHTPHPTHLLFSAGGYYAFIETSTPRRQGDKARLLSPLVPPSPKCLRFWYLMYGGNVASLNIYMRAGSVLGNPVFTRSKTQSRAWLQANVDVGSNVPIQVRATQRVVNVGQLASSPQWGTAD